VRRARLDDLYRLKNSPAVTRSALANDGGGGVAALMAVSVGPAP